MTGLMPTYQPAISGRSKKYDHADGKDTQCNYAPLLYTALVWYFRRQAWEADGDCTWIEIAHGFEVSTGEEIQTWCPTERRCMPCNMADQKGGVMGLLAKKLSRMLGGSVAPHGCKKKA